MNHHKNLRTQLLAAGIVCLLAMTAAPTVDAATITHTRDVADQADLLPPADEAPDSTITPGPTAPEQSGLYFVENRGQLPDEVRYQVMGAGMGAWITDQGLRIVLSETDVPSGEQAEGEPPLELPSVTSYAVFMNYEGATPAPALSPGEPLQGYSNYIRGSDPEAWVTGAQHYERVVQHDVWPGIDIEWYGEPEEGLKFDVLVRAGADPSGVSFQAEGATDMVLNADGNLALQTPLGDIIKGNPVTYQLLDGEKHEVSNEYVIRDGNMFGFNVGVYDSSRDLIIDPLIFSTYLGGSDGDYATSVDVDDNGNVFVAGGTRSTNFPTSNAYQGSNAGGNDAFVSKFTNTGNLVFSTYYGGSSINGDAAFALAVDSTGISYITGYTYSTDLPTLNAYQSNHGGGSGGEDAFVASFTATGGLSFATYLGGNGREQGRGIAVDDIGRVYISGFTDSTNFPLKNAYQTSLSGSLDTFLTKLNTNTLVFSTYFGGSSSEFGWGVAVDTSRNMYISGKTHSSNFPTTNAYQSSFGGGQYDAYVAKFNAAGSLTYSTYLGGNSNEAAEAIAAGPDGSAYITGFTTSSNFPEKNSIQNKPWVVPAAISSKLTPSGGLEYSTYIGGNGYDWGLGIDVDQHGNAYIAGRTESTDLPTKSPLQSSNAGGKDAFVYALTSTGLFAFGSYLGGGGDDEAEGISVAPSGAVLVAGYTTSTNYPTLNAHQGSNAGSNDAFVSSINLNIDLTPPSITGNPVNIAWQSTIPTLSGVSWQDTWSGLEANARFSIGTTSGGTNVKAWTTMPVQPTSGQTTSWSPSWSPSMLAQGTNYINILVEDVAENVRATSGAYTVQYDSTSPTATGATHVMDWSNTSPPLGEVCFQDPHSGLAANARYWVGSTQGASDLLAQTTFVNQPASGATSAWCPSLTVPEVVLQEGINHVTIEVEDVLGHVLTSNAYQIRYDASSDDIQNLQALTEAGGTAIPESTWQNDATPFFTWSTGTGTSPIAGYSYTLSQDSGVTPDDTVDTEVPQHDLADQPLATGMWFFRVKAVDEAGNWGPTASFTLVVDASEVVATGAPTITAWSNTNTLLTGVCFQDADSGLEADARYWLGTSSGTADLKPATSMPVQPTSGQTTLWCPDFQVDGAVLLQGSNHVTVETTNTAGTTTPTNAYELRFDSEVDAVAGLLPHAEAGGAALPVATWQTDNTVVFQWSASSTSPIQGYSIDLDVTPPASPDTIQDTAEGLHNPSVLADGQWFFKARAGDEAGNWGPDAATEVWIDTTAPTASGAPIPTAWSATTPVLSGVCFQDVHSGLAASATYWVGSTPGASDQQSATALPVQPTAGDNALWCPSFSVPEASLVSGVNHVTIHVEDVLGHIVDVQSYEVRYDDLAPVASGDPVTTPWSASSPTLSGVCFQDVHSGLDDAAVYWVGSTQGASDLQASTLLGAQPVEGQSASWCPSFAVPEGSLIDGVNYVTMEVQDALGHVVTTNAYVVQYDFSGDAVTGLQVFTESGGTVIPEATWTVDSTPFFSWTEPSGNSPVVGYSYSLSADVAAVPDDTVDTTQTSVQVETPLAPSGEWYFRVKAKDESGNWGAANSVQVWIDTSLPVSTGAPVTTEWSNTSPSLSGVCFQDVHSGLAETAAYWVGSSQGASDLQGSTAMPVQPVAGQSSSWCPAFVLPESSLQDGLNYVTIEVADTLSHELVTHAYVIQYDSQAEAVQDVGAQTSSGGTIIPESTWQQDDTPFFSWSTPSSTSPVAGYSYSLSQDPAAAPDDVVDVTVPEVDPVEAPLADGTWFFEVKALDGAGNWGSPSLFELLVDTSSIAVTGAPTTTAWTNTNPRLSGLCFQDDDSGLTATAVYWMGSTPGASDLKTATAVPVQPTQGQATAWCPDFEVDEAALLQGSTYVTMQLENQAGIQATAQAYEVRYDAEAEDVVDVTAFSDTGGVALPVATWQPDNTPFFDWSDASSTSPTTGYSIELTGVLGQPDELVDTVLSEAGPSLVSDGKWFFSARAGDEAGNWGAPDSVELWIDAGLPTSTGAGVVTTWSNTSPSLSGVCFQDAVSGLASAEYRVGSVPGSGTWQALPVQPVLGDSSWCPEFMVPETLLVQGSNHVGVRVVDQAGNALAVEAYEVRFDNVADAVSGLSAFTEAGGAVLLPETWNQDRTPYFEWTASSVSPIAGYSVQFSENNVLPDDTFDVTMPAYHGNMGNQDWANGKWEFIVVTVDEAGNVGSVELESTFRYWLDDLGPRTINTESDTHPQPAASQPRVYYNRTAVMIDWMGTDTGGSGIDGYAYELLAPGDLASDLTLQPTTPTTTASFSDVGPFGAYRFRVQAVDVLGQWGPVTEFVFGVDTIQPEYTLQSPFGFQSSDPRDDIRVLYNDLDNGFDDQFAPVTEVDASSVLFFVDGVDMRATWEPICGPDGPLYGSGCRLDITAGGITYEPLLPWSEGAHEVFVQIQDTVVDANVASTQWQWTFRALEGVDPDNDLVPEDVEALACSNPLVREAIQTIGECTGDDFEAGFTITVPIWVSPGPDSDQDGVPAYLTVQQENVTFDPDADPAITREPAPDKLIQVDTNDDDPSNPNVCNTLIEDELVGGEQGVLIVLCGQSVPNVLVGLAPQCFDLEDNDGDGFTDNRPLLIGGGDPECANIFDNDEAN